MGGHRPQNSDSLGWRQNGTEWDAQGQRIGWIEDDNLYLEPESSYAVAQALARDQGESLTVTPPTLRRRLRERGLLVTTDDKRQKLTIRVQMQGVRRDVLHLYVSCLYGRNKLARSAHSDEDVPKQSENGPVSGPVCGPVTPPKTTNRPTEKAIKHEENGKVGRMGRCAAPIERACGARKQEETAPVHERC
jgi:hypothetical protein